MSQSDLQRYLTQLAGEPTASGLIEIRFVRGHGMGRLFLPARATDRAARLIQGLSWGTDVYVGVVRRGRRRGSRDAVLDSHLAFIEIDSPHAGRELAGFPHPPTMVIASGSPGHLHAYWRLEQPIGAVELERANRRLAHHLGGDLAAVDAARILRPPQTNNHKHVPPAPVRLITLSASRRYPLAQLAGSLPDPPGSPARGPTGARRVRRHPVDRQLLAMPANQYVSALTGRQADRAGKVSCPFHDDHTPSLQLYDDGTWYCFGCLAGGSLYDFAARLWQHPTKGKAFPELRRRLADELGLAPPTGTHDKRAA